MDANKIMPVIEQIRSEAKQEREKEVQALKEKLEELTGEVNELSARLKPLKKFEPIIEKEYHEERMTIVLRNMTVSDQQYLDALAREHYPALARKVDEAEPRTPGVKSPVNRMFEDLVQKLISGHERYSLTEFQRLFWDKYFEVHDG